MAEDSIVNPAAGARRIPAAFEFFGQVFRDQAVRHGIKFGLAGLLSLYLALLLKLPEPAWALITVFVLMLAQYVGAVAEKSMTRIIGTAAGGVIGYLLTASLEQDPVLYLALVGGVVGFGTAMFGYTKYPYGFLLCALTTMVVAANGMNDPEFSWRPALVRVEEVGVGVIASMLVTSLVWPHYARREFLEKVHLALRELQKGLQARAGLLFDESATSAPPDERPFSVIIAGLRNLLHFGALESQYFRARLPTYTEIVACLSRIAAALETLGQTLPRGAAYRRYLQEEIGACHRALIEGLGVFADEHAGPAPRQAALAAIEASFRVWQERLHAVRGSHLAPAAGVEEALAFSGHALSLNEIAGELDHLGRLLESLPENPLAPSRETAPPPSPPLDPFWLRNGFKAAVAVTLGLLVQNWLKPPGGSMVVLATWVFTVLSRLYPRGQGDRRAFHSLLATAAGGLVYVAALLVLTPALSDYTVFNLLLFVTLFLFGYLTQAIPGVTFGMQIALLATVGVIGLNPQKPVGFEAIAGVYFGIVFGLILSALVQRLIWPVLPQWELRDRILELIRLCRTMLQSPPDQRPLWLHQRLALIPGEAAGWIAVMNKPDCPPGEQERLDTYLTTLRRAAGHLSTSAGRLFPLLPADQVEGCRRAFHALRDAMDASLSAQAARFRLEDARMPSEETFEAALQDVHEWIAGLRRWILRVDLPVADSLRLLGIADRFEFAGAELLDAARQAARLRARDYMGDFIL